MKQILPFFLLFLAAADLPAQVSGFYYELPSLPERVTNNAVTAAWVADTPYVYSFCGLDSTKIWSGIHLKAWRMNLITQHWEQLPSAPDPAGGKIATAASTVKGRVYLIGGYHVAQNGAESSSAKVHRFDPVANAWLSDGANLPKPIDDQVQAVWRDSLIFVITGWSNTGNLPNVQIYNPSADTWLSGTPVPDNTNYKVFGASGIILNDTIYYCGGARQGSAFPATTFFRKGYIDPANPAQISWTGFNTPNAQGYRMAAAAMAGHAVWVGGANVTYNYNGIAYNGSGGVPALSRVLDYDKHNGYLSTMTGDTAFLPAIMDSRGAAQIGREYFVTAGGMEAGQNVSRRVFGYHWAYLVGVSQVIDSEPLNIYPNPAGAQVEVALEGPFSVMVFNMEGKMVLQKTGADQLRLETKALAPGPYLIRIVGGNHKVITRKMIIGTRSR